MSPTGRKLRPIEDVDYELNNGPSGSLLRDIRSQTSLIPEIVRLPCLWRREVTSVNRPSRRLDRKLNYKDPDWPDPPEGHCQRKGRPALLGHLRQCEASRKSVCLAREFCVNDGSIVTGGHAIRRKKLHNNEATDIVQVRNSYQSPPGEISRSRQFIS
ncbi:hypothetical protein WN51_13652 [Melipona quadrifasciata]|uniref:Uncharacterized protein n=1 Tax=Melipona quadrifasciata TaxID=166423 RepID=A0A0M8ZYA6_9HYME|nr:hypothetical protein WN51_13652 [Melipona quadrifasciata]